MRRAFASSASNGSDFTPWFDETSLYGGPGMLELDHAIVVCLRECLEGE